MSKPVKVMCPLFLALLLSFQLLCCHGMIHSPSDFKAKASEASVWEVYYEGRDESAYRLNVGKYVSGLEIWLFISTNDSYAMWNGSIFNNDYIKLTFVSKPIVVVNATGQYIVEPIVGLARIGYRGDREKSVGGVHGVYYVLPKERFVSYVNVTLHAIHSTPRLDTSRSYMKEWDPVADIVQLETWNKGWRVYDVASDCKGRASAISFGTPVGDQPMSSGLTWYFGRRITPPKIAWKPDVYVEVGYAGGINLAPESFAGTGNYKCKINVGVGSGSTLEYAVANGLQETVYMVEKDPRPTLVAEEAASGEIDILLEILQEIAESPATKKALEMLGHVLFVLDLVDIILTLGFDETVAESRILVFKDLSLNEDFFVWFNFYAEIATAGLCGGIVNFWGECPFGHSVFDDLGLSVVNLPDGGMQIGGVLFDYHDPYSTTGKIITICPEGYVRPPTWQITTRDFMVYCLTDDIDAAIVIIKDNIILDGCGHRLRGGVAVTQTLASCRENVTVKSLNVEWGLDGYEFYQATGIWPLILESFDRHGILLIDVSGVEVLNCSITGCQVGVAIIGAESCIISGNKITNSGSGVGIYLRNGHYCVSTGQNIISENIISMCEIGIFDHNCWGPNNITRNHLKRNGVGVRADGEIETISYNDIVQCRCGIVCLSQTGDKVVLGNVIVNCSSGIDMWGSTVQISRNRVVDCVEFGIRSDGCSVSENEIINCTQGIVWGGTISGNNIVNCTYGINYGYGNITDNNIAGASFGIYLTGEEITARQIPIIIQRNNIVRCHKGTVVEELNGVVISGNNYIENDFGICMAAGWNSNHVVSENNFLMNNVSIFVETDYLTYVIAHIFHNNFVKNGGAYGDPPRCVWDVGYPVGGNYWSNYVGVDEKSGAKQDQPGADGIGDEPHFISGKAVDNYPLMEPTSVLPPITTSYLVQDRIISLTSNSVILGLKYDSENQTLSFNVQGKRGTRGFVSVDIPKSIVSREVEVLFDGRPIPFNKSEIADYININFTYEHTKHYVEIRFGAGGGVPPQLSTQNYIAFVVTAAGLLLVALLLALYLRRRRVIPSKAEPLPPPPPPPPPQYCI